MDQMTMFKVQAVGGSAAVALLAYTAWKAPVGMPVKAVAGVAVLALGYMQLKNVQYAFASAKKEG